MQDTQATKAEWIEAEATRLRQAIRDGDHAYADEISDSIRATLDELDDARRDEPR